MGYVSRDRSEGTISVIVDTTTCETEPSLATNIRALDLREGEKYIANSPVRLSAGAKRQLAHASTPLLKSFYSTYYGSR